MSEIVYDNLVRLFRAAPGPLCAFLVDGDATIERKLTSAGAEVTSLRQGLSRGRMVDARDLWFGTVPRHYRLVLLNRRAPTADLYRFLSLSERLVAPGGLIALVCPTDVLGDNCYQEAVEIFTRVYPEYTMSLHKVSNTIELRRAV